MSSSPGSPSMLPPPELPAERRSALVIATGTYADAQLAALRTPAQDAAQLAEVLGDPHVGEFDVTALTDRTAAEIRVGVEDFLAGRATADLLLVYMSCHGILSPAGSRLYFAAADTRKDRLASTGIESQWLLDRLDECRARRQILVLDCCFSGAFAAAGAKGDDEVQLQRRLVGHGRGRVVLTASRAGEYSFEGHALPGAEIAGSVFTAGLVEGLRTGDADYDEDGLISVEDAFDYAYTYVQARTTAQTPQRWAYGAEGKIWLARNPARHTVSAAPLPAEIRQALENRLPDIRIGALAALAPWLTDSDPARVLAARAAIQEAADNDIPRVAKAARAHLDLQAPIKPEALRQTASDSARSTPGASQYARLRAPVAAGISEWALAGHTAVVSDLAFSPDGALLATADGKALRLWNPHTRQPAGEPLKGNTHSLSSIHALAFSPDSTLLAAADDKTLRFWNPHTRQPIGEPLKGNTHWLSAVTALAFSPDSTHLAVSSHGEVRLWNLRTRQPVGEPLKNGNAWLFAIQEVAFSPDGTLLATVGGGLLQLWSTRTYKPVGDPMTGHTRWGRALAFSPDGRLLASAVGDSVQLWDPRSREPIGRRLIGHTGRVIALAFSPDGSLLASGSKDRTALLWDLETRERLGQSLNGTTGWVVRLAFSPDGSQLAAASGRTVWLRQLRPPA